MKKKKNFAANENLLVLGGVEISERTLRRVLLDFDMDLDRDLGSLFFFRNGGVMVYFSGVRLECCLNL
jgi:hypothetical protein